MSSQSELTQLANLITSSLATLQEEWKAANVPEPSLDPSSPDPPAFISVKADKASRTILGAAKLLSTLVQGPYRTSTWQVQELHEMSCVDVLLKSGIADIVTTDKEGTSVDEIAQQKNMNANKLIRVMRLLTTMDIFTEVKDRYFRITSVGKQYRKDALLYPMFVSQYPTSFDSSAISFSSYISFSQIDIAFSLYDALTAPDFAHSFAVNKTAFNYARKTDKGHFEDMFTSADPEKRERFVLAMKGMGVFAAESVPRSYHWGNLGKDATVVDVGGGTGHIMMAVLRKFPNLKVIVQDVESAINVGKRTWREEFPEAVDEKRVDFMEHDFFKENPMKGADAYYMRAIIHDWPDSECVQILKNIAISMSPKSRLLINEMLVEPLHRNFSRYEVGEGEQGIGDAPEPLTPNYGDKWQFQRDHMMMLNLQGKERNREEFVELVGKAGLEVVRFWTLGGVESAIIECRRT